MSLRSEWINRLRHLRGRSAFEGELDEEMRFHIEARSSDLEAVGLSHSEALAQARREFGSDALAREGSRVAWELRWLEDLAGDLRQALRGFRRNPAFTLTAALSLALGIGGASAIYTAIDAALWRPLPVTDPASLVRFSILRTQRAASGELPAPFVAQLQQSGLFAGLTVQSDDGLSFSYDGRAERILGEVVSPGFFSVLGVSTVLGQGFTPEVRNGNWAAEAVLSYRFWKRRFGGDPHVIGRTIQLNSYPFTIVGVSEPSFYGLDRGTNYEVRIPILPAGRELAQIDEINGRAAREMNAIARLKPGVGILQSEAAADAQFQEFLRATSIPRFKTNTPRRLNLVTAERGFDAYMTPFRDPLYILLALSGVVLLIVCANIANMLLARGVSRAREIAIRASIGAGRFRLVRQLLAESMLLSVIGGIMGVGIASWASGVLFHFLPQGHIPIAIDLRPDSRSLLFTFAAALFTGILFGLAPAIQATRGNLADTLKSDSVASTAAGAGSRFRQLLVVAQVAFAMTLLMIAGVFVRTLSQLRPADFHSNPGRILLFTMKPQVELYSDDRKRWIAWEVARRVSRLAGVQSAAFAEEGPLGSRQGSATVEAPGNAPINAGLDTIMPGFLETVGISLIAGRDFDDRISQAPLVAIVNRALVDVLFPGQNPVGRTLTIPRGNQERVYEVVGVAANAHYGDLHKPPEPFLWLSMAQNAPYMPTLHVRVRNSDSAAIIAAVRHEFDLVDKGFPVFNIKTMSARIEDSMSGERMVANLSGAFGALALALAAIGIYGILAYSVSRRTREIGIRMALGANSRAVLWMLSREAFALVTAGAVCGIALAVAGSRALAQFMIGISPPDLSIAGACALVLFIVSAVAVAIPGVRGARTDPLTALRRD